MGISDPTLALTVIDVLRSSGVPFALLHADSVIDAATISDLDIVVGESPRVIVNRTLAAFEKASLLPVVGVEYDLGGYTVWYATPDASDGVQVDLLYDLEARGRLGLRTGGLMELVADGEALIPCLTEAAELVYLWRKGVAKRQSSRLQEVRARATDIPRSELVRASRMTTGSNRTASEMYGSGRPLPAYLQTARHPLQRGGRLVRRIRKPVGFWVHTASEDLAVAISLRFGRFLPRSGVGQVPGNPLLRRAWHGSLVQAIRLRPGLYVSYGIPPDGLKPDFVLGNMEEAEACVSLVKVMMTETSA